jgi:hypothetical protein
MSAALETKPLARILDVTEEQYRADPCEVPSLNQSTAHTIITKSPLHAWHAHPRLGNAPRETTIPKIEGTVIHALLLGKGADAIEILKFDDYRTKAAQMMRDDAMARGKTPVLEWKHAEIQVAADTIRMRLAEQGCVFEGGMSEVSIEWYEEGPEGPVLCRGRLDYLIRGERHAIIYDPKKITSADATTCMYHADDYGHHLQPVVYTSAVEKLWPELKGRVKFFFPFMEIDAPFAAVVREPSAESTYVGQQQWKRAVATWQQCLRTGIWPSYPIEPLYVSPRTSKREEELAEQELLASSQVKDMHR